MVKFEYLLESIKSSEPLPYLQSDNLTKPSNR